MVSCQELLAGQLVSLVLFLLISHTAFICNIKVLDAVDMLPNAIVGDLMDFIVEVCSEHPAWV